MLISPPILAFPDFTKDFALQTDASNAAIGAVLGKKDDEDLGHPIAFASRTIRKSEQPYSTVEKETLAIVYSVKYFHHYIYAAR